MAKRDEIIVGLDLGSTKVCAVVGELSEFGGLNVLGVGTAASTGLRQGVVVSIDDTVAAIGKAVEEAETMSGVEIRQVVVGVSGSHLKSINNRATVGIKAGDVSAEDIANVLDAARAVELSRDEEIVFVTPQRYILDNQEEVSDPVGMAGNLLTVEAHVIAGAGTASQNLFKCVEGAGLAVGALVPQPVASANAVLSPEELELGVALLDIGGGTTDLAIYTGGSVRHTWVLPLGGSHVTRDISFGLATPLKDAERIKIQFGGAMAELVGEDEHLEVPSVGGRPPREVQRRLLAEIAGARMEEIFTLVAEEITRTGLARHIGSGLVITGGGALLADAVELGGQITGLSCRRGTPVQLSGLADLAGNPKNATAIGLVQCALRGIVRNEFAEPPARGLGGRLRNWVREFF